jgi:hypothetical protein
LRRVGNRIVSRIQNLAPNCLDSIQFNSIQLDSTFYPSRYFRQKNLNALYMECQSHQASQLTSPQYVPRARGTYLPAPFYRRRYEIRRVRTSLSPLIPSQSQSLLVTLRHPPLHNPASPSPISPSHLTSAFQRESPITCMIRYRTVHGSSGSFLCTNMRVCLSLPD